MEQPNKKKADRKGPNYKTGILLGLLLIAAVWIFLGNTRILVSRHLIADATIPDGFNGFRMAQVSDLHNHDWGGQLIGLLQKEAPDVIFITGDLIDSNHLEMVLALEFAEQATAIAPVYFVTGNHEAWSGRSEELKKGLEGSGVVVLANEAVSLERAGDVIQLLGMEDPAFLASGAEADQASGVGVLEATGETDAFQILLAHRPELMANYTDQQIDLVLAGHAHGGQFRVPLLGGLFAPDQGFLPKYSAGLYQADQTRMIVSRGLGSSVIPIRINNPPELVIIELKAAAQ